MNGTTEVNEPIVCELAVAVPPAEAFRGFTEQFGSWWPSDYTFSKAAISGMHFGRGLGEWCYEQGPFGFRCDWGRILKWEPPHLLAFTWQIGPNSVLQPDPDQCTQVCVRFIAMAGGGSCINLTHQYFERHGVNGVTYRSDMASQYGWPLILSMFARSMPDATDSQ